jgi:hypothetical protein
MPMFQHRHYVVIAAAIADGSNVARTMKSDGPATVQDIMEALVIAFASDNPNFDENRFRLAARCDPAMHGKDKR